MWYWFPCFITQIKTGRWWRLCKENTRLLLSRCSRVDQVKVDERFRMKASLAALFIRHSLWFNDVYTALEEGFISLCSFSICLSASLTHLRESNDSLATRKHHTRGFYVMQEARNCLVLHRVTHQSAVSLYALLRGGGVRQQHRGHRCLVQLQHNTDSHCGICVGFSSC